MVNIWGRYELVPVTARRGVDHHDDEKDIQRICMGEGLQWITWTDTLTPHQWQMLEVPRAKAGTKP